MYKEKKEMVKPDEYMEVNISPLVSPKIIKIGKGTSRKEIREIKNLVRKYRDVFTWSYDNLKYYKGDII
jgi:hypothetical protein